MLWHPYYPSDSLVFAFPSTTRSWFQRQQTCPTCRESVLKRHPPPPTAPQQPHVAPPGNNPADRPPFPPAGEH